MTRLYAENAEKEPAYLPQKPALVNRESRMLTRLCAVRRQVEFRSAFWGKREYGSGMRLTGLREQLSRYRSADEAEARFVARMTDLTHAEAALTRSHYEPGHFTASAFVLSPDRRQLILIHHKKLGIWVQPGGHVDATDPDLESAARREVEEEVGLRDLEPLTLANALFDLDIHMIPGRKSEPSHEHFDVRFAFVSRTLDFARSEEVTDVRWVALDDVGAVTSDRSVLRAVEKLRAIVG